MENYTKDSSTDFEYGEERFSVAGKFHCHSRVEIFRVTKGKIRMCFGINGSVYDAYKGDYVIIKSADIHRIFTSSDTCTEYVMFPLSFQALSENSYIRQSFIIPADVMEADSISKNLIDSIFLCAQREYEKQIKFSSASAVTKSLCALLCSVLLEKYSCRRTTVSQNNDKAEKSAAYSDENVSFETIEKFDKALFYINENFCDKGISLSVLSGISGINKTYLSSLFPKLAGKHFTNHIHHLRINRAIELMHGSEKNISEIAFSCGFETIRSFNNVFKAETGITPSAFLSALRGKEASGNSISTEVRAHGKNIFGYNWTSNVELSFDKENATAHIICKNTSAKLWCHLRLKMLLFPGQTYRITYKAKALDNPYGIHASYKYINCTFHFPDRITNAPFHHPDNREITELDNGWMEYTTFFTVPEYYIPSTDDVFSLYSSPAGELGVSFLAKDITVERTS